MFDIGKRRVGGPRQNWSVYTNKYIWEDWVSNPPAQYVCQVCEANKFFAQARSANFKPPLEHNIAWSYMQLTHATCTSETTCRHEIPAADVMHCQELASSDAQCAFALPTTDSRLSVRAWHVWSPSCAGITSLSGLSTMSSKSSPDSARTAKHNKKLRLRYSMVHGACKSTEALRHPIDRKPPSFQSGGKDSLPGLTRFGTSPARPLMARPVSQTTS